MGDSVYDQLELEQEPILPEFDSVYDQLELEQEPILPDFDSVYDFSYDWESFEKKETNDLSESLCDELFALLGRPHTTDVDAVRRHWELSAHCQRLLVPEPWPRLALPTAMGSLRWHQQGARARPVATLLRRLRICVSDRLNALVVNPPHLGSVIWTDQLFRIDTLDAQFRKTLINNVVRILRVQTCLRSVCLEEARLERGEGLSILEAITCSADVLRRLYLWNFVRPDQHPLTIDTTLENFRGRDAFRTRSTICRRYLDVLSRFDALTVLALRYSHLCDWRGTALLSLGAVNMGSLRQLQLLCERQDLPDRQLAWEGAGKLGGCRIPEHAWKEACRRCPKLSVHLLINDLPCEWQVRLFMSRSMPLKVFHYTTGMDLQFARSRYTDALVRVLKSWHRDILEVLCLHLWSYRDAMGGRLPRLPLDFPRLRRLEFSGRLLQSARRCVRELCEVASSGCNTHLRQVTVRLQQAESPGGEKLSAVLEHLQQKYEEPCRQRRVQLQLQTSNL